MNLKQVLNSKTVSLDLAGSTKQAVIEELLDLMIRAGKLSNREEALKAVLEREAKMSTGMQNGVAIPHAKTDSVTELITAVGIKQNGVDFGSLDGKPAKIFILTLSPVSKLGPHIQFLSALSQSLDDPAVRRGLLRAHTPQEIVDLLTA